MNVDPMCAERCAYGTCRDNGGGGVYGCGGCCACLGACVVEWENTQTGDAA